MNMPSNILKRSITNNIFISKLHDPYVNLTIGSYLANTQNQGKTMFLSTSHHGVFIGKNQNCWKECDMKKMNEDNVPLVRRDTGGGACYVDSGNVLFSFIEKFHDKISLQTNFPI